MIRAYEQTYLNDAMNNLGDMFDYAINDCGYMPEDIFSRFLVSKVAEKFEKGNPKYVAGLSGPELVCEIEYCVQGKRLTVEVSKTMERSPEYWAGWILAYYQWYSMQRFSYLQKRGLTLSKVISMYSTLHEADISKFVSIADGIIKKNKNSDISNLKKIRKAKGITQKELSKRSGTSLRMIQLYEQKQQDIKKAEALTLVNIARTLGCEVEDIFD